MVRDPYAEPELGIALDSAKAGRPLAPIAKAEKAIYDVLRQTTVTVGANPNLHN